MWRGWFDWELRRCGCSIEFGEGSVGKHVAGIGRRREEYPRRAGRAPPLLIGPTWPREGGRY